MIVKKWTRQENEVIIRRYADRPGVNMRNFAVAIAPNLPGRTEDQIWNHAMTLRKTCIIRGKSSVWCAAELRMIYMIATSFKNDPDMRVLSIVSRPYFRDRLVVTIDRKIREARRDIFIDAIAKGRMSDPSDHRREDDLYRDINSGEFARVLEATADDRSDDESAEIDDFERYFDDVPAALPKPASPKPAAAEVSDSEFESIPEPEKRKRKRDLDETVFEGSDVPIQAHAVCPNRACRVAFFFPTSAAIVRCHACTIEYDSSELKVVD